MKFLSKGKIVFKEFFMGLKNVYPYSLNYI